MTTETSSTSSPSSRSKHDVFLSFRGEDTGNGLTDYLYNALEERGITTFRYDHRKTNSTSLAPSQAIEESGFAIVVFSKQYASSTRCLDELAMIFECMNKPAGLTVYPVFYHVNPTHVKEHDFEKDEQVFRDNKDKVGKWKEALTKVANLNGWDLQNRHETDFIKEIVEEIFEKLNQTCVFGDNGLLVGMVSHVADKLVSLLDIELNDVRTIGICGVRGIGKTTLANQVFKRVSHKFEASAFLSNIGVEFETNSMKKVLYQKLLLNNEKGVMNDYMVINNELRKTLRSKRVLIVLEDVDSLKQIENLVGEWKKQHHSWLSPGSRLIVTTRKKLLLRRYGEKYTYEVDKLTNDEALQLLCQEAFDGNQILDEYKEVSNNIVEIANGHPLTLKELGSLLYDRSVDEWWEELAKLKENPNKYKL